MKRFHVHMSVRDLNDSIRFYSALFGAEPSVRHAEYAKWMLEDPRVNFAISTRSGAAGIDHLGIQAETADELADIGRRFDDARGAVVAEPGAECCHARSDKLWSQDPQGTRWEAFHTVGSVATYHGEGDACPMSSARAVDLEALAAAQTGKTTACCDDTTPQGICCAPKPDRPTDASCCGPVIAAAKRAGCAVSGCDNRPSKH